MFRPRKKSRWTQKVIDGRVVDDRIYCNAYVIFLGDCIDFGNVWFTLHKCYLLKFTYYDVLIMMLQAQKHATF